MLVVLEAAGMLVNRVASEWQLAPGGPPRGLADHRPVRRPSRLGPAIGRRLARLVAAVRQAYQRRELIRVLSAKDDRLLADIGIARGQIREVADAAVKRGPLHASRLVAPAARVRHDAAAVETTANDNAPRLAA